MKNDVQCLPQEVHINAHIDSEQAIGSFQSLQLQSKQLLRQCSDIQSMMQANRQSRTEAQHTLAQYGRHLYSQPVTHTATDQALAATGMAELLKMRQQIADLEEEHVRLHQQFIALQAQIREVVRFQRRRLEETIKNTKAAGASKKRNATSTELLTGQLTNCASLFLGDFEASNQDNVCEEPHNTRITI